MGDFAVDTAVHGSDGTYSATLNREWEIWGPMGGYIATFALRAAGEESACARPASFFCHYLGVAGFEEPIDIHVYKLRSGRTAESMRVTITPGERSIMEATVWTVGEVEGLAHRPRGRWARSKASNMS